MASSISSYSTSSCSSLSSSSSSSTSSGSSLSSASSSFSSCSSLSSASSSSTSFCSSSSSASSSLTSACYSPSLSSSSSSSLSFFPSQDLLFPMVTPWVFHVASGFFHPRRHSLVWYLMNTFEEKASAAGVKNVVVIVKGLGGKPILANCPEAFAICLGALEREICNVIKESSSELPIVQSEVGNKAQDFEAEAVFDLEFFKVADNTQGKGVLDKLVTDGIGTSFSKGTRDHLRHHYAQHDIQAFYLCTSYPTLYFTGPVLYLFIHSPGLSYIQIINLRTRDVRTSAQMNWLRNSELRGYSIDGWLLFTYDEQLVIYYNPLTLQFKFILGLRWSLTNHVGVFSSSPLEDTNVTVFTKLHAFYIEIIRHTQQTGWEVFTREISFDLRREMIGVAIYKHFLAILDDERQLYVQDLDRYGNEEGMWQKDLTDGNSENRCSASLIKDAEDLYVVDMRENTRISLSKMIEVDNDYNFVEAEITGEKSVCGVGYKNGYMFDSMSDLERHKIYLAGNLDERKTCICISDGAFPLGQEIVTLCSRLEEQTQNASENHCKCNCAFARVGAQNP